MFTAVKFIDILYVIVGLHHTLAIYLHLVPLAVGLMSLNMSENFKLCTKSLQGCFFFLRDWLVLHLVLHLRVGHVTLSTMVYICIQNKLI